jgi:hypothetical protein
VKLLGLLIFILFGSFISTLSWAGEVKQVKGTKALLVLSEAEAQVGAQFYVLSSEGKKIGIIEIKQSKNGRAIAEILKGRAEVGGSLLSKAAGAAGAASKTTAATQSENTPSSGDSEDTGSGRSSRRKYPIGILAGMTINSFAMNIGPKTSTSRDSGALTGTGFNLKAFGDYDFTKKLTFRAAVGVETFAASGSIAHTYCDSGNSASCSVNFMYLGFEGSGHYNYLTGKTKAWVGLGYSYLLQASSSNNIPNLDTGTGSNQMILVSTGADFGLSKGQFIPVVVEYGLFPGSADVKATSIFIRGGYGITF